jgi:hypothetical protein
LSMKPVSPRADWAGRARLKTGVSASPMPPPTLARRKPVTKAASAAAAARVASDGSVTIARGEARRELCAPTHCRGRARERR